MQCLTDERVLRAATPGGAEEEKFVFNRMSTGTTKKKPPHFENYQTLK